MFKFDFFAAGESGPEVNPERTTPASNRATQPVAIDSSYGARKMDPSSAIDAKLESGVEGQIAWQSGDTTLIRAIPSDGAFPTSEESDLVPGVYEGGMKVWEASIDLVDYLASIGIGVEEQQVKRDGVSALTSQDDGDAGVDNVQEEMEDPREVPAITCGSHVLELGCGHGFPGIMALRQGMHVCFSDFNSEVIEQVTIPNVRLNVPRERWDHAEYYCGDWSCLSPLLHQRSAGGRFKLILTAETLYTTAASDKVLDLIVRHLAVGGRALLASKRFYFGTGGSTQYFRELVEGDGRLRCRDVAVVDTGKGNIRELLQVDWKEGVELHDER